jgi:hypothetical protein
VSTPKSHLVRATKALATGKWVLFVEGKDDEAVYAKWLAKIDPLYAARLEVIPTNGRNDLDRALPELGNPAEAFALRDRDEWDGPRAAAIQATAGNLLVNLSRHCLENSFSDPDELIGALLARDAGKYGPAEPALRAALSGPLADWVDHWSMWTTAMRLQEDMVSAGYASYFHNIIPLPPDPDIQARLDSWGALVPGLLSGHPSTAFGQHLAPGRFPTNTGVVFTGKSIGIRLYTLPFSGSRIGGTGSSTWPTGLRSRRIWAPFSAPYSRSRTTP